MGVIVDTFKNINGYMTVTEHHEHVTFNISLRENNLTKRVSLHLSKNDFKKFKKQLEGVVVE
jgi:hypothetical protein